MLLVMTLFPGSYLTHSLRHLVLYYLSLKVDPILLCSRATALTARCDLQHLLTSLGSFSRMI